jgi:hypothetical protein
MDLIDSGKVKKINVSDVQETEAQIAADIYAALKSAGYTCFMEFAVNHGDSRRRIDILVVDGDGYPAAAIEVKRPGKKCVSLRSGSQALKQRMFYTWLTNNGVKSRYVDSVEDAIFFVNSEVSGAEV